MFCESLPEDQGMLFKFPDSIMASFWGKNTYIPLDIGFIHNDTLIDINHITPHSTRMIHSKDVCKYAVEVNAGFFDKHGIKPGVKVHINESTGKLEFHKD